MDGGGGETNSGMFVKPNILNSIMISLPNIWGVEIYFWIAYKAQHFQFYPDICVKYLGVETYFWKMCTTQDFSFYPDIFAKICVCVWGVGYKNTAETKHSFYPNIRAKHSRGCKHISVMCIKCNIFNSILIFVSNIWGVEPYFWDFLFILIFVPNTWEVETYFWEMCTTQCFSFYPDIRANHLGGEGGCNIFLGCV